MAVSWTYTATNAQAVRLALAVIYNYWQQDFIGVIIQNATNSNAMLSDADITALGGSSGLLTLNDTQINALVTNGIPTTAFQVYMKSKNITLWTSLVQTFERNREQAQVVPPSAWSLT